MTTTGVPIISLSRPDGEEAIVICQLLQAFETNGFAVLVDHGIDKDLMDRAIVASQSFFAMSIISKLNYQFQGHESNRGYIAPRLETHHVGHNDCPDPKETFKIGKEYEAGFRNVWPTELAETTFRRDLLELFQTMDTLYLRLMRMIAIGLKLRDPNFLVKNCNQQHSNLQLVHYFSLPRDDSDKRMIRRNMDYDFGTLTLQLQDDIGGFQAQNQNDGNWIDVAPVPHGIIVNVGEMLMRWTNDRLKAAKHQLISPPPYGPTNKVPESFSITFYCNANKDATIKCLDTCRSFKHPAKYPPVNAHKYLKQRLSSIISND